MSDMPNADDVVVIKKYANRRLYNTESSTYITLDNLAQMTREGRNFKVVDAKSGEDITHNVLTQIIMDEESRGPNMLPVNFLRQLISMYGDSMQSMVPQYLESSMEAFRRNQEQFRSAMEGAFASGPFAEIARQNMAFIDAATSAFRRGAPNAGKPAAASAAPAAPAPAASTPAPASAAPARPAAAPAPAAPAKAPVTASAKSAASKSAPKAAVKAKPAASKSATKPAGTKKPR